MANKSSKSPSGEDREQPNEYMREEGVDSKDIKENSKPVHTDTSANKDQPNQKNRGYEEDQPHNPVRSTGSTAKSQESLPTGEPDKSGS